MLSAFFCDIIQLVIALEKPQRKPNRLKGYDYSTPGYYFITMCSHNHKDIFADYVGAIHESPELKLTAKGVIVNNVIKNLPDRFGVIIDKYVIMPNHLHFIVIIRDTEILRAIRESPLQSRSVLSKVMGYIKMNSSKQIHNEICTGKIWQRSFHDHIIRDEKDYQKIWQYIDTNPTKWNEDCFYLK